MNLTEEELTRLKGCKTQTEWNQACDAIKRVRGGQYPPDWFPKVHMTGLMAKASILPA